MADAGTNDGSTNEGSTSEGNTNDAGTNEDGHVSGSIPLEEANTSPTRASCCLRMFGQKGDHHYLMADAGTNDLEQTPGSKPSEEGNESPDRPQVIAMEFVVHVSVKFDDSTVGYSGGRVGYMTFLEPEGVDWFIMLENLAFHGYKGNASLYYLKPGGKPPQGLVLMESAGHLQQLLKDHEGLKTCKLFIVKPPRTSKSYGGKNVNPHGNDSCNSDDSDSSIEDEEYAWEDEEEDEDLYVVSSSNDPKQTPKERTKKSMITEIDNAIGYLPEEPSEDVHSSFNSDDEGIYVHRSLGVDYVRFDESTMRHPIINVGTVFTDVKQFRKALKNLIIDEGRRVWKPKNESERVSAKCSSADCPWYIYASRLPDGQSFKVKKFVKDHSCGKSHTIKQMDAKWIGSEYEEFFRSEKDWRVKSLRDTVLRDTQVGISRSKAYRAKKYAVQQIGGDYYEQYRRIQDYAHTALHLNPGSCIVIKCFVDPARVINPRFERMYVSFDAQVKGFLAGCRPFIGLDGTHVKLPNGGQILTAQGRDGNNNLFPIAFALVEAENRYSWTWFLELLVQSIGQGEHSGGWTIMSDRQKGLKDAVKIIFPHAEHRYCLRHLYANFKKAGFTGPRLKQLMDRAAYAYKEFDFKEAMDEIKKENTRAWKWLCEIDSKHWSRHRFSSHAKTDLVVNNISESYNSWILEAREEPVCTMMEHIRTKLMQSINIKRDGAEKDTWFIAPNYKKRLEFEKKSASSCRAICAGRGIWQVTSGNSQYLVDLNNHKCGCYKWDVTGVPCLHAVAAIHEFKHKPEDYMSLFFTREKYIASYEGMIMPVPDKTQWIRTDLPDVDPPLYHAQPGRPKKKRVRAQGEPHVEARASKRAAVKCSNCHTYGHNVKGCGVPLRSDWEPRKGAKYTRESVGVPPPASQSNQPVCEADQPNQPVTSMCEARKYNLVPFEGPVFMNNDQGIGIYHDIEGGPQIRPRKLFPLRKRTH